MNTPEATRLVQWFFPESRAAIATHRALTVEALYEAMAVAGISHDFSYYPWHNGFHVGPLAGMVSGHSEDDAAVYRTLLARTGFVPTGRAVLIPDAPEKAIVCDSRRAAERIDGYPRMMLCSVDWMVVFASGEALVLDHDNRLFWARSRSRR